MTPEHSGGSGDLADRGCVADEPSTSAWRDKGTERGIEIAGHPRRDPERHELFRDTIRADWKTRRQAVSLPLAGCRAEGSEAAACHHAVGLLVDQHQPAVGALADKATDERIQRPKVWSCKWHSAEMANLAWHAELDAVGAGRRHHRDLSP